MHKEEIIINNIVLWARKQYIFIITAQFCILYMYVCMYVYLKHHSDIHKKIK